MNKKISPQEGNSQDNVVTEEYSNTNVDLEVDLSTNSEESQEDIENPDNLEVLEDKALENPFSFMEHKEYNTSLREINLAKRDIKSSIDDLPVTLVKSLDLQSMESERKA